MEETTLTDDNFEEEVLKSEIPVLVDFWAPWCGPCRIQGPIVEELAKEAGGTYKVGKLEVDSNPSTAQQYSILSIPTIMIFKDGKPHWQASGVQQKNTLEEQLQSAAS